jgi:hypothetical protein
MDRQDEYTLKLEAEIAALRNQLNRTPGRIDIPSNQQEQYAYAQQAKGQIGRAISPEEVIDFLFTFHDDPDKTPHYTEVREAAKAFAKVIVRHVPACGDRLTAVIKVREAVMFANAAIALDGRGL